MCTIWGKKFKRHYLKNKRLFVHFLLHFWNVHAQFGARSSNAIISKTRNLEHFEKKDEYPSLIISEIMDCERGGYLNV